MTAGECRSRSRSSWCAWRESNPLPCGPETRITRSAGVLDVPRGTLAYSAHAIGVRVMMRHAATFAGIRDPVVIPDRWLIAILPTTTLSCETVKAPPPAAVQRRELV